jgi:serine phosphatase RsbU (regulator of sigma subunit)
VPLQEYHEATVEWKAGEDLLCLFTDGLSDALGTPEQNGEDALVAEVVKNRKASVQEIIDRLFQRASTTSTDIPPDDRSAFLIRA